MVGNMSSRRLSLLWPAVLVPFAVCAAACSSSQSELDAARTEADLAEVALVEDQAGQESDGGGAHDPDDRRIEPGGPDGVGATEVAAHIRQRGDVADRGLGGAESFIDLLPTTSYLDIETGESRAYSHAFVIGEVVEVEIGRYFANSDPESDDDNDPDTFGVEPDDPNVAWATIHLTIAPTYVATSDNGGRTESAKPVVVGLAVGDTVRVGEYVEELRSTLSTVAVVLWDTPVFAYDSAVHGTLLDGSLFGVVGEDDRVQFPFAADSEAGLIPAEGFSLAELQKSGTRA